MANLFWKTPTTVKPLISKPFKTEEELEKIVFETSELLKEIFLLKRQIRRGNKSGIPDMIGIDNDGTICIVEIKNCEVDASIIPQVLQYAFWAEKNPDSIKSLWLECNNRPEDISVSWEDIEVRIVIIAPSIKRATLDLVNKINYPVDLIEVKRWVEGNNEILLINKLEAEPQKSVRPVSGQLVYDEEFYKTIHNRTSVEQFLKYKKDIERLIKNEGWNLESKLNKNYCGFKLGFFNAFGIKWLGTKTFGLFFKISKRDAEKFKIPFTRYETLWKEAVYVIEPGRTKLQDFKKLFELAYKNISGE